MSISVVMAVRNEERHIGEQLSALVSQEFDGAWELLVMDNGSTDGTRSIVERFAGEGSPVRWVDASEHPGQSYAANLGVKMASSDRVVFCDGDDVVSPGWLSALASGLEQHQVVTGPNELDRLNPPWLSDSRGRSIEEPVGNFYGFFPTVRGNNYGVRREVWDRVGGLASDEFAHILADQDFSLRCWLAGVVVVGLPGARVHYRYRTGVRALWRQGFAYGSYRPLLAKKLWSVRRVRPPRAAGWKSWFALIAAVPYAVTRNGRARLAWIAGNRFGQLLGSLRHRFLLV